MNTNDIMQIVKGIILEVLPGLSLEQIEIDKSLKELGANSIDRMEVVTMSMEALGIKVPMTEFGQVTNIEGLIGVLTSKVPA